MEARHDSVLLKEVLGALDINPDDTVVDATVGGAGHFSAMLAALSEGGILIGIDADSAAVERGREVYARDRRTDRPTVHLVNDNFRNLTHILERLNVGPVDKILFDLGWSGYQISSPRGFSFSAQNEPLLMNYAETGDTAADIVNSFSEEDLTALLFTYGEEHFARGIAHAIVAARKKERIITTGDLVTAIKSGIPALYKRQKIHPATKTFQALRIAVNDEIGALREGLLAAFSALRKGGILAVISFHSIEDRVVKDFMREKVEFGYGEFPTKKPITPSRAEVLANHRARSAKLRIFKRNDVSLSQLSPNCSSVEFSYA